VDEVERWKIRWAFADVNPERDYSTIGENGASQVAIRKCDGY